MPIFLTPGPAQTYPLLRTFMDDAWAADVMSISHRGKAFSDIYRQTDAALRELIGVPEGWQIMFMGSATEAMERVTQGLVRDYSHHFVNGAFSKKWHQIATQLGKAATAQKVAVGHGFGGREFMAAPGVEMVAVTMNETSTGVVWPEEELRRVREFYGPEPLLVVDVVSAAPMIPVPWDVTDAVFFSVQKAFGLPAGLGVLLLGPRAQAKARLLAEEGVRQGSYHALPELMRGAERYQTPPTPNVLGIYLLGRVAEDLNKRGVRGLREENLARAGAWYDAITQHEDLDLFVADAAWRSPTVVVAEVKGGPDQFHLHMREQGFVPGPGYGELKDRLVRIANFPAISNEEFDTALGHLKLFNAV